MQWVIIIVLIILLIWCNLKNAHYDTKKVFPELIMLENKNIFAAIQKEALNTTLWEEWPEKCLWEKNINSPKWNVIPLYAFGKWSKNAKHFPRTSYLIQNIPNIRTAGFSLLEPNVTLKKHRGWANLSNYVLRSHLLLTQNKTGSCFIDVKGIRKNHKYGKWLTFDDSELHSASNLDNQNRIILLIDIDRPSWISNGTSTVEYSPELINFIAAL